MAKEEWAISGKYLLKALEDLEAAGVEARVHNLHLE